MLEPDEEFDEWKDLDEWGASQDEESESDLLDLEDWKEDEKPEQT